MKCHACGAEVVQEAVYCQSCGARLDIEMANEEAAPTSQPVANEHEPREKFVRAGRPHGEVDEEEELWEGGYSPKAMVGRWITATSATIGALLLGIWISGWLGGWLWYILLIACGVLWIKYIAELIYKRMSVSYKLTNKRFVHRYGILRRTTDRIETIDMDDITRTQGLIERFVGVGTIIITSSDRTHPELRLIGIDNVDEIADLMDETRRQERERRGLHIEAV